MATPIKIKRSAVSGKRPQLTDLQLGELALNTNDGSLFTERDTGGVGIATTVSNLTPWTESYGASSISYLNSVGIGTDLPEAKLDVFGQTKLDNLRVLGVGTFNDIRVVDIDVVGVSTFNNVQVNGSLYFNDCFVYGKLDVGNDGFIAGILTASTFFGNGAGLTNLNASNIGFGTIPDARFPATLPAISGASLTDLTGVSAGTYGNSTVVPQIDVDANGRITGITNVSIAGGGGGGGSSLIIKDSGSVVGTAGTIDFGSNLSVSPLSSGIVTVTGSASGIAGIDTTGTSFFDQLYVTGVSTFTSYKTSINNIDTGNEITYTGGNINRFGFPQSDIYFHIDTGNGSNGYAHKTTNDNERFRITSDGNIGIGTEIPTDPVVGSGNTAKLAVGIVTSEYAYTKQAYIGESLELLSNSTNSFINETGSGNLFIKADDLIFNTADGNTYLGKIKANAPNPSYLEIAGNIGINEQLYHNGDTDTLIGFPADNAFAVQTNNVERVRVANQNIYIAGNETGNNRAVVYNYTNGLGIYASPSTNHRQISLHSNGSTEILVASESGVNITGILTVSSDANFGGNVSIAGTLTYEDVTNIDSIGIITAQSDVHVGAGLSVGGVSSFTGQIHGNNQQLGTNTKRFSGLYMSDGTSYYGTNKLFTATSTGFGLDAYGDNDAWLKANVGGGDVGNVYLVTGHSGGASGGYLIAKGADAVELHHSGSNDKKFETTSSGAIVTGILTATSFSGSGANITGISTLNITNYGVGIGANIAGIDTTGISYFYNVSIDNHATVQNGNFTVLNGDLYVNNKIIHYNNTSTYIEYDTDLIKFGAGGNDTLQIADSGTIVNGIATATSFVGSGASLTALPPLANSQSVNNPTYTPGQTFTVVLGSPYNISWSHYVTYAGSSDRNGTIASNSTDPTININVGDTLIIDLSTQATLNNAAGPTYIKTTTGTGSGNQVTNPTATNNGTYSSDISWTPTQAGTYYYQNGNRVNMVGQIVVSEVGIAATDRFISSINFNSEGRVTGVVTFNGYVAATSSTRGIVRIDDTNLTVSAGIVSVAQNINLPTGIITTSTVNCNTVNLGTNDAIKFIDNGRLITGTSNELEILSGNGKNILLNTGYIGNSGSIFFRTGTVSTYNDQLTIDSSGISIDAVNGSNPAITISAGIITATSFVKSGGTSSQYLMADGSVTTSGGGSYGNSDVDSHLNTSTAASGEVLSWTGSDYDWVAQSGGGGGSGFFAQTSAGIHTLSKVGIGTTNPQFDLDLGSYVAQNVSTASTLRIIGDNNSTAIRIGPGGGSRDITVLRVDSRDGSTDGDTYTDLGHSLKYMGSGSGVDNRLAFWVDNTSSTKFEAFSIYNDGKVLVDDGANGGHGFYGTPSHQFTVRGSSKFDGINVGSSVTATSFVKSGGTSSQYLMADGSVTTSGGGGGATGVSTTVGTFTIGAGSTSNIDSFAHATNDYKVAEYTLHFMNGANIQAQKLLVMQDGTNVYSNSYGVMASSNPLVSVGSTIDGTNVYINVTAEVGVSGITTYRWRREVQE